MGIREGEWVTGVDHLGNHREFRRFFSNSLHTCDPLSFLETLQHR